MFDPNRERKSEGEGGRREGEARKGRRSPLDPEILTVDLKHCFFLFLASLSQTSLFFLHSCILNFTITHSVHIHALPI